MSRQRTLAAHLALTHALVALLGCALLAVLVVVLVPRLYLAQRQQALRQQAAELAAEAAPWLAGRAEAPAGAAAALPGVGIRYLNAQGEPQPLPGHGLGMGMGMGPGMGRGWRAGRGPGWGPGAGGEALRSLWPAVAAGRTVDGVTASPAGERLYLVMAPAVDGGRVVGGVALHARLADLQGAASAVAPVLAAALAAAGLAAVLAGAWLSRRVAGPLERMTAAVQRVAAGDRQVRVEPPAWQEGEALAEAFNHMTATLHAQEEARRHFVADASHQLRAPLTALQARAEAMLDGVVADEAGRRRYLADIVGQTHRLAELAQHLLDLERLEAGETSPQPAAVDLPKLLAEVAAAVPAEGARIAIEPAGAVPPAWADPAEVRQALANLVDNALKYTPAGGEITLSARREGDLVRVTVADQGPGIPPEHLGRVWDRFYRVPGDDSPGSGLGLAIVKRLIERQGGQVRAESEPGAGAVFSFTLRRQDAI